MIHSRTATATRAGALALFALLLFGGPAAIASIEDSLLDPVSAAIPSLVPTPDPIIDPETVDGALQKPPGAPDLLGSGEPEGAGGGPGRGSPGSGGSAGSGGPAGPGASPGSRPGAATDGGPGAATDGSAGDGSGSAQTRAGPASVVADVTLSTHIGTLASNAASLARPLSLPLGLAVAAVAAVIVATRRPRRLAKIDDEGTWGNGRTAWRL